MYSTLVVVADSGRARLYGLDKKGKPMLELTDMVHTGSRMRGSELISDRPGRTIDRKGSRRHAKEVSTPIKVQEAMKFALQINEYIDGERKKNNFSELVLIAAPEFLGILRKTLGKQTGKLISREIDKNLVLKPESVIRKYLVA